MNSFRVSFRVFIRQLRLIVPYLAILAGTVFVILRLKIEHIINPVQYLSYVLMTGVIGVLYFSFAAYELSSVLTRLEGQESVDVHPGASFKLLLSQLLTVSIFLLIWTLTICVLFLRFYFVADVAYTPFIPHALSSILLYCFLPGLVAILLGLFLARRSRPVAYTVIIVFALMSSYIPLEIFSSIQIGGFSLAAFLDWFFITVPNASANSGVPDPIYGIAMESVRWALIAFWLAFLFFLISRKQQFAKRTSRIVLLGALIVLIVLCGGRYLLRSGDYVLQRDERPHGILEGESTYRLGCKQEGRLDANFSIESYDLVFDIDRVLVGQATLQLAENNETSYPFTLHHGYEVSKVEDSNGEEVAYERNGDNLLVQPGKPLSSLTVYYKGFAGKYYSNRQAILLPAYVAYYPLPGRIPLWDYERSNILTDHRLPATEFNVEVKSPLEVYSNLASTEPNRLSGTAQGLTMYAGFVTSTEVNGLTYIHSPLAWQRLNLDLDAGEAYWQMLVDKTGAEREFSLDKNIIFYQPIVLGIRNSAHEKFVALDDHMLILDFHPKAEAIAHSEFIGLIPLQGENFPLFDAFSRSLEFSGGAELSEKPPPQAFALLKQYSPVERPVDQAEAHEYIQQEILFDEFFRYQMVELGEKTVLSQVYSYLMTEDHTVHYVDFLYNLEADYD